MIDPPGEPIATESVVRPLHELLQDLAEAAAPDSSVAPVVQDLADRWARARLRVMLLGEAKRGKSTVANALLRRAVLPTGAVPLTAVTTVVRAGAPERVEAHLRDGTTLTRSVVDLAELVTEGGNPGNRLGVREAIVFLESPLPHPAIDLVDTPGVGSVLAYNTTEAELAMQRMDVAVLVLSADPPISAAERDLLQKVNSRAARTFVVLNKIDRTDEQDRPVAERFTRAVIADAVGTDRIPLLPVSARDAVRAVARGDELGWRASGLGALLTTLQHQLQRTWRTDLTASIAGAAEQLASELIDERVLAQRARELLATRQADRVVAFRDRLDQLDARGQDAAVTATAHLRRCQAALNEDAASILAPQTEAIRRALDERLAAVPDGSPADLEAAGWSALTRLVVDAVTAWRLRWTARITAAAAEAAERQQHQLDAAVADVRAAASELLGVDLTAAGPVMMVPTLPTFAFDITPEIGWTQPVTSAVRRHLPGSAGRRRMIRFLHAEAERMIGKHIGRARSDFQVQISRIDAELVRCAWAGYTTRRNQLLQAIGSAERAAGGPTVDSATTRDLDRLHRLHTELDVVRVAAQQRALATDVIAGRGWAGR